MERAPQPDFEMHVGMALGVEADTLFAALDDHSLAVAMGNALEDLIACEFDDDRNIVDEYLARRGWKLSAPGKRWLKALRHSRASLWEAVALDPGRSMTLKGLLAGGKPIVVDERMGSRSAAPWDRVMTAWSRWRGAPTYRDLHFSSCRKRPTLR